MRYFTVKAIVPADLHYTWTIKADSPETAQSIAFRSLEKEPIDEDGNYLEPDVLDTVEYFEDMEFSVQETLNVN